MNREQRRHAVNNGEYVRKLNKLAASRYVGRGESKDLTIPLLMDVHTLEDLNEVGVKKIQGQPLFLQKNYQSMEFGSPRELLEPALEHLVLMDAVVVGYKTGRLKDVEKLHDLGVDVPGYDYDGTVRS